MITVLPITHGSGLTPGHAITHLPDSKSVLAPTITIGAVLADWGLRWPLAEAFQRIVEAKTATDSDKRRVASLLATGFLVRALTDRQQPIANATRELDGAVVALAFDLPPRLCSALWDLEIAASDPDDHYAKIHITAAIGQLEQHLKEPAACPA